MSNTSCPAGLGLNVGHDESTADYYPLADKIALINQQCSLYKSLGIMKMRINMPSYTTETQNTNYRDSLRRYALIAKTYGMYVIMGYHFAPLTTANLSAATANMLLAAAWCTANGIDEITCGNEEDLYVGFNNTALETLRPRLQTMCQTVKTENPSLVVSTAITTNVYDAIASLDRVGWKAQVASWSTYMKLNLHIYFSVAASSSFDSYADNVVAALGATNVYCGEFGVNGAQGDGRLSTAFANDEQWVIEENRRMERLRRGGWESYYYFVNSAFDNDEWSAFRRASQKHTTLLWKLSKDRPNQINVI